MNINYTSKKEIYDLLQFVLPNIGEAVIVTDLCTNILFMNSMAEKLTGYSEAEAFGRTIVETFRMFTEKTDELTKVIEEINNGAIFRFGNRASLITANDKRLSISGSISPVKNETDKLIGLVILFYNVTEQRQLEKQLQHVSIHDALTGLYNRTWFQYELLRKEEKSDTPIALIMCDIDGLKIINDTMGHRTGDAMIISTARILKECVPPGNIIARIGGDEFTILLNGSSVQLVSDICNRIKYKISNYNEMNSELPLSVSLGFSVSNKFSSNISSLFQEADNNMYKEKLYHNRSIRSTFVNTIMRMIETKDFIIEGHCERLKNLVELMAFSIGLSEDKINDLRLLAEFHDIGKVGIPDGILLKQGALTDEEKKEMQRHCEIGHHIVMLSSDISHIANWILNHHEWWNGNGYPQGLKGENIPIECRILSIIDAYDAMTNDRPYRKAMSHQEALLALKEGAGIQFDPLLVFEFIQALETLKIYVASSVKESMLNIKQVYIGNTSQNNILFRFGGSGTLKQQIEKGALADIFISAASKQMDDLQMKGLIIDDSREDFLQNRIVLITAKNSNINCSFKELVNGKIKKIAIGNPDMVSAGKYAQEVLMSLGILEIIKSKLVFAKDVRQVLNYVETGTIDVGIVYQTDVIISNKVKILDWATDNSHSPVLYPVAIMKATNNKTESEKFIKFLTTNNIAREIFEDHGFMLLEKNYTFITKQDIQKNF